jgi:hypothetical protein
MGGSSVVSTPSPTYDERLGVPLRWWALATMFLASVLLAFLVALPAGVAFGAFGVMVALVGALFVGYGAAHVTISDGEFIAGSARIPVKFLAEPTALDAEASKRAIGVEANARAFIVIRPYLKRSVKVSVVDPADPTPYWLVSTRHPRQLTAALTEAISTAGH